MFILLFINNKKFKDTQNNINDANQNYENYNATNKKTHTMIKKLKKVDDFKGKSLEIKKPFYQKFITEDSTNKKPNFPSLDDLDEDDLL